MPVASQAPTRQKVETRPAPTMLLPDLVERMIVARQARQIVKFRTTCTDCVPNL